VVLRAAWRDSSNVYDTAQRYSILDCPLSFESLQEDFFSLRLILLSVNMPTNMEICFFIKRSFGQRNYSNIDKIWKKCLSPIYKEIIRLRHYIFQQLVIGIFKSQTISYNFVHWSMFRSACVFHFLGLQTKTDLIPSYFLCLTIHRGLSSTLTNTISVTIQILSLSEYIIFCCSLLTP
jgi:hypothetical protein